MDMLWPLVIVLVVGVMLSIAEVFGPRLFPGSRPTVRAFRCPVRQENVQVGFAESVWDGHLVDVEHCSAFTPPTAVTCDKKCVHLPGLPKVR